MGEDSQHTHAEQSTFAVSMQGVSPFMQSVALVKSASICERLASACCMQIENLSACKQQELN